jgi:hypothetical protein
MITCSSSCSEKELTSAVRTVQMPLDDRKIGLALLRMSLPTYRIESDSVRGRPTIVGAMCIEYARAMGMGQFVRLIGEMGGTPPFVWTELMPSPGSGQFHIQIGDEAMVARLEGQHLAGEMMSWGWKDGRQVIFNMKSENCECPQVLRILILATGFYEFVEPADPLDGHRDRHLFTMRDAEWFWIAGVTCQGRFAMLTTRSGPDVRPYRKRQPCLLAPSMGMDWLTLAKPQEELLASSPAGTLMMRTLHEMSPVGHTRYQFI